MTTLLRECNPGKGVPELPELGDAGDASWSKAVGDWTESQGLKAPSKVAVANWLIENGRATPSASGAEKLRALHGELLVALGGDVH